MFSLLFWFIAIPWFLLIIVSSYYGCEARLGNLWFWVTLIGMFALPIAFFKRVGILAFMIFSFWGTYYIWDWHWLISLVIILPLIPYLAMDEYGSFLD